MNDMQTFNVAGTNAHRVDGHRKGDRQGRLYQATFSWRAWAMRKILRSPVAHARLLKVDATKAKELPGVIATLTRDDIKEFNYKYGATYKDQSIVAVDKVQICRRSGCCGNGRGAGNCRSRFGSF